MASAPTLLCVHAHPDDESLFTAGLTAHYNAIGYNVVLVTCTKGQLGRDRNGRGGDDPQHLAGDVAAVRAQELVRASELVGVHRLVQLGYDDSGMRGWPQNDATNAFMATSTSGVATTVAALIDEVNANVVVTYDHTGFYGHPDHIKTHDIVRKAVELSASAQRLFYPVVPFTVLTTLRSYAQAEGIAVPEWVGAASNHITDADVATVLDVSAYADIKQSAIAAHVSQIDNQGLCEMSIEHFQRFFGVEYYQLGWSRCDGADLSMNLFEGLT
jgi:LmbE family N-acetylglucosaminyl deacetylase